MQLIELRNHLDILLDAQRLKDYCPNGLQVEGRPDVVRVLCGVTASQALLDRAVAGGHDAVFVHHGLFWKGEDGRVTGFRRQRLRALLANDINLFAYHLPLDVHPELGNNAQLGKRMGWQGEGRFADQDLGWIGRPREPGQRAQTIAGALAQTLGRLPLLVGLLLLGIVLFTPRGVAALFGRADAGRRPLPMSASDLLEAGMLIYLNGLGLPPEQAG